MCKNAKLFHSIKLIIYFLASTFCFAIAEAKTLSSDEITSRINKIDNYLSKSEVNGFSGAVLVSYKGNIIFNRSYGLADKKNEIPATTDMVYDIGSLTKQFTAAGILHLVKEGKISTEDTLSKFFDNLPYNKKEITIHQLLTHTSGIADYPYDNRKDFYKHIETNTYFDKVFSLDEQFTPGKKFEYSNTGYSILSRIIELVTNENYEVFLARVFFTPLGMSQTGYLLPNWDASLYPKSYRLGTIPGETYIPHYQKRNKVPWQVKGAAGIYSTVTDMHKWLNAIAQEHVLTPELITQLKTPYVQMSHKSNNYYGYGWVVRNSNSETELYHNGSNLYFTADIHWQPVDNQLQVIMLSNINSKSTFEVPTQIVGLWEKPETSPKEFKLPAWRKVLSWIS